MRDRSAMVDHHHSPHQRTMKPSWGRTVITQAALCLALYAAFKIGTPRTPDGGVGGGEPLDLYFLSVRGGVWPLKRQTQLLQQMEKAVKIYKVKFVVNLGELGQGDPLLQNATLHFPLLKIPWYTTTALHGQVTRNFLKKVKLRHDQVLDIVGVDTGPFQDFFHARQLSESGKDQLDWMQRTLAVTNSNWRIIVGFDPLIACEDENATEKIKFYEPLRNIFLEYGANAYLSQQGCAGYHYKDGGFVYIGHPGPEDTKHSSYSTNGDTGVIGEMHDGFLLHRVGPLEIESYYIDSASRVVFKSVIHQHGRGTM